MNPLKKINAISENIDHLFRMQMGTLIIFMQAGFAFLEAGAVRSEIMGKSNCW